MNIVYKLFRGGGRRKSVRPVAGVVAVVLLGALLSGCSGDSSDNDGGSSSKSLVEEVQGRGELRVGVADATPDLYKDPKTGEWAGVYLDVTKAWADTLGVKQVTVETSWDQMVAAVQAGRIDIAPDLDVTPERALSVQFSDGVRTTTGAFALAPDEKSTSWSELNKSGKTVCITKGQTTGTALKDTKPAADLLELDSQNSCLSALIAGRANAIFDTTVTAAGFADANPGVKIMFPEAPIVANPAGLAIRLGYPYSDLAAINAQIARWKSSPTGLAASLARHNANVNPMAHVVRPVPAWAEQMIAQEFPQTVQ